MGIIWRWKERQRQKSVHVWRRKSPIFIWIRRRNYISSWIKRNAYTKIHSESDSLRFDNEICNYREREEQTRTLCVRYAYMRDSRTCGITLVSVAVVRHVVFVFFFFVYFWLLLINLLLLFPSRQKSQIAVMKDAVVAAVSGRKIQFIYWHSLADVVFVVRRAQLFASCLNYWRGQPIIDYMLFIIK